MQAIRSFFKTYRKSLDQFKDGVKKALLQFEKEVIVPQSKKGYKIGQKASNFPQTKKSQKTEAHSISNCLVDTLGSCLFNTKLSLDETIRIIENVSVSIQGELVDGLDIHEKNYVSNNKQMMKRSHDLWNRLSNEKMALQQAKEDYFVQMANYTHAKKKADEKAAKKAKKQGLNSEQASNGGQQAQDSDAAQLSESEQAAQVPANNLGASAIGPDQLIMSPTMSNPYDSVGKIKQHALQASQHYESALEDYNDTVTFFDQNYVSILNKVQESDKNYSDFIKEKMTKFSSTVMQFGMLVKKNGEDLHESSKIINSQTDLEIFIETNKSTSPFIQKEQFEVFDENVHGRKKTND